MRRLTRPLWMIAQLAAVGVLTWGMSEDPKLRDQLGMMLFINVCIVAFLTGLLTLGWDFIVRVVKGHPKPPPWRETPDQVPGNRGKALRKMLAAREEKALR